MGLPGLRSTVRAEGPLAVTAPRRHEVDNAGGSIDIPSLSPNNGRPEPRVLVVEHQSADSVGRWHRALEILLEAGIPTETDDEDDG